MLDRGLGLRAIADYSGQPSVLTRRIRSWPSGSLQFRLADPADASAVANLHAESWRRHYRGAYCDLFLDGAVFADRQSVWSERLRDCDPRRCTILAEDDALVGFASTAFEDDARWGALLENLHVRDGYQRRGVGSRLLGMTAEAVIKRHERTGLYLWVLEQNVEAQAFYEARGGRCVGRDLVSAPGGVASRLTGSPARLRYAWGELDALVSAVPQQASLT